MHKGEKCSICGLMTSQWDDPEAGYGGNCSNHLFRNVNGHDDIDCSKAEIGQVDGKMTWFFDGVIQTGEEVKHGS